MASPRNTHISAGSAGAPGASRNARRELIGRTVLPRDGCAGNLKVEHVVNIAKRASAIVIHSAGGRSSNICPSGGRIFAASGCARTNFDPHAEIVPNKLAAHPARPDRWHGAMNSKVAQ